MSLITLTFPDGAQRQYDAGTTAAAVAQSIAPSLAKKAVAANFNGSDVDLDLPLLADGTLSIITRDSDAALPLIRHDAAHVMAEAVQKIFPGTQVTIGPSIENGFYYDFYREQPFTTDDLAAIEAEMKKIVERGASFTREVWSRKDAINFFKAKGEHFKVELIENLPGDEDIRIYKQGEWLDLCRGPHMPTTKHLGTAFKLMSVAGAYWRGDHTKAQLQRIYGTAWREQKELDAYLDMLKEAEARDHRKLGKELELFHQQEEAVGNVFWHPKGWVIWQQLENFIRGRLRQHGYHEVRTPQLIDRKLWEESGHWEKFGANMFTVTDSDKRELAIKPMNCPAHVQIFKQGIKSYRDLPLRLAEFGCCHRNEPSGALHGIMRVRAFTQDDAHIFCTPEQVTDEALKYCQLQFDVYRDLGFDKIGVKLSLRPDVRAGTDETWDKAENGLREALRLAKIEFTELPGEGAFYGPKVEFQLTDAIGRTWQCGTLQLDFVLPERLDATYIGEDGAKHRPVMLHRALLGSMERFIGILIEHYAGRFPLWLAPVQIVVATITEGASGYAQEVVKELRAAGLRAELDIRNEKINYKIREHSLQKIPIIAVIGAKEAEDKTLALRRLGSDAQEIVTFRDAIAVFQVEAKVPE
ncbi:MAG TPA: threonine--tRNA ligase [Alphaproteobacteria bacterium]|nr:threonine--tRNA ligase [Rhodospirillaceae bacterium]HRJ11614.1 threonine--tRNA ligase [Alphaproteobacteria bacterium]